MELSVLAASLCTILSQTLARNTDQDRGTTVILYPNVFSTSLLKYSMHTAVFSYHLLVCTCFITHVSFCMVSPSQCYYVRI